MQTYGYEHIITLQYLEKAGLIRLSGSYGFSGRSYSGIRNKLKLTWNVNSQSSKNSISVNGNQTFDIGHVHNGYTPLSVRIVQHLEQFGLRSLNDVLQRHLIKSDVAVFDEIQKVNGVISKRRFSDSTSLQSSADSNQKVVVVLYIGGCTISEISSLRLLSQKENLNTEYIVATTSLINGKTFLQSLTDIPLY